MGFGDKETHPVYKGDVKNGKPNGLGYQISPIGWKYVGSWKNGKEWNTKHTKKDGTLIEKWEKGEKVFGVFYLGYRNGEVGYYSEKWEGIESDENSDNGKYDGEFKNGKPNGIGKLHMYFYGFFIGEFKNGKYWKGIQTNEEGDILVKYRNGKRKKQ